MLADPAAAAWKAAGRPALDTPLLPDGQCGRCGQHGNTVLSSRIISEKFTGFDAWPFGSRRLCTPCAWSYSHQPTTQPALLITTASVTEHHDLTALAELLAAGPLPTTSSAILPTARRRHILPTAEWAHVATDGLTMRWDSTAAQRITELHWLRATVGASWPQICAATPPHRLLTTQPSTHWPRIIRAWSLLAPWRTVPPMWATARILTMTVDRPSHQQSQ